MNANELNDFIKHYIEKDKTKSALMLTAPWGTGKSYYINNILVPFLNDNCKKKCIIVSLYGLKDTKEVSKSIFFESKIKAIAKNNIGINAGKIIAKTVVKGIASFFGVDLNVNETDLNNLYTSIDLTDNLIILEDVERSQIDILELLGFVNNLVEQDGVKVLLVTNEDEILHYETVTDKNNKDENKKVLDEKSRNYMKIKEKTVGDTIMFYSSNRDALKSIIEEFNNKHLNSINCDEILDEIEDIMENTKCANLRSFIFGCQKTIDIIERIDFEVDTDFFKNIFLSNVAFCLRIKNNDDLKWLSRENTSADLGTTRYPLHRFSYNYICFQNLNSDEIKKCHEDFCLYKKKMSINKEMYPYYDIIYSYYIHSEVEVIQAVKFILKKLKETNDIPYEEYGKLANYLIAIKYDLECNSEVDECKETMLSNIINTTDKKINTFSFYNGIPLESNEAIQELDQFEESLKNKLDTNDFNDFNFNYTKKEIQDFCNNIYKNKDSFITKHCFARKINNVKLVELLKECSAAEIEEFRRLFLTIYSFSNIKDFFANDKESIEDLKIRLEELINNENSYDKIQKKQINWFIDF